MWKWNGVIGVLVGLGSVCCTVTVRPQNTVALKGERTSLECRTTNESVVREWSFIPSSNPTEQKQVIFSNWNSQPKIVIPRFGVDIDEPESGTLYTNETQFDDGGTYTCTASSVEGYIDFNAELIVLDSEPVCSVKENVGRIRAECSVGFSGNWAPKMEWRHHSRREEPDDGTLFTEVTTNNTNRTHVTSKLDPVIITSAKDSFFVSCKIFFDARDRTFPSGSAANIPSFVRFWTFPVYGSTDIISTLTTSSLDVVRATLSDQSTHAIRTPAPRNIEDWTIILVGAVVFAVIVISVLSGAIFCIIRRKQTNNQSKRNVDTINQKKVTRASDPNIYESILLDDDNGYRIPLQDSIDGDSRIESLCRGSLDPYYVTTLNRQSTSREAEKIGRSNRMNEAKPTSTEFQRMRKLPNNDNVDSSAKFTKQQNLLDSSKLSEVNYVEVETDEAVCYLQIICDPEDKQDGETESSSRQSKSISPNSAYTSLIL